MNTQKQQRLYTALISITVILLLVAQFLLLYTFKTVNEELTVVKNQLEQQKRTQEERFSLVQNYQSFEIAASSPGRQDASFPASELELYTMVEGVLTANSLEHTNRPSSGSAEPGGELRLAITFNGTYYDILKTLAAFRDTQYVIRVADFNITGQDNGLASGSMVILSRARS
jgi:hypothetical protein